MKFLQRIFGGSPKVDAVSAKTDELTYLLNYRDHYSPILESHLTDLALAELYLFRCWTTKFGYQIFSNNPDSSDKLIEEMVNTSKDLGLVIFKTTHGFSIEGVLGDDYINLLESRWQSYDEKVLTFPGEGIPTFQIIYALGDFIGIHSPVITSELSIDFLAHLAEIKRRVM